MSQPKPYAPPAPIQSPGKPTASAAARARRMRKAPTAAEKTLWDDLRKLDLGIQRQVPIGAYIADFASHAARVVFDLDRPHDGAKSQKLKARAAWLRGAGYRVVRFPEAMVNDDLAGVVARIKAETAQTSSSILPPAEGKQALPGT